MLGEIGIQKKKIC